MEEKLQQNPPKLSKKKEASKTFKIASRNFIEMCNFAIYGFYAAFILFRKGGAYDKARSEAC
ncbi:hypothetical protein [Campylobacter hyointestinalis]|uniref:Uncharacterized protein n=1 Tax=Campylobacter hyointestinalis subsp. hyointestinalis TaxID=91352 RepID=A0A9W5AVI7_CAMHY|nr:hypothetical protein [Campylobacter hyointestinalis]PPB55378.1 hypothetical protein CDQ69_01360 [Campylobacter hyointestinalis subsp. hyointestinalis]PPB56881.1 hypothetical protein CDQ67_01635 [Campylobacter hyointestinalis subsp. hyointestinalis]PPB68209.1 hypothetical protein CDQ76_03570 [Campylobacter hyointestinalis subsp. hyointestinalis]PPB71611.1 hypothetical protein CDQ79_07720 [Campylobacter hyointestinalis subsp. hyointestinalis]PPB74617.1 hypothetical protein CDQ80_06635 [Campyl